MQSFGYRLDGLHTVRQSSHGTEDKSLALPQSNEKAHPMRVCPFGTMVLQVVNTNYGQYNGNSATVIKPVGKYSLIKV